MPKIDIDKFICSLIERYRRQHSLTENEGCYYDAILEEQGLECRDGEIVPLQIDDEPISDLTLFEEEVCSCSNMNFSFEDKEEIKKESKRLLEAACLEIAENFDVGDLVSQYRNTRKPSWGKPLECEIRAYRKAVTDTLDKIRGLKYE